MQSLKCSLHKAIQLKKGTPYCRINKKCTTHFAPSWSVQLILCKLYSSLFAELLHIELVLSFLYIGFLQSTSFLYLGLSQSTSLLCSSISSLITSCIAFRASRRWMETRMKIRNDVTSEFLDGPLFQIFLRIAALEYTPVDTLVNSKYLFFYYLFFCLNLCVKGCQLQKRRTNIWTHTFTHLHLHP